MAFMKGEPLCPAPYRPQFRQRAIALVREGRQVKQTAADLGIHEVTLHSWLRQDDFDDGRRLGIVPRKRLNFEQHDIRFGSSNKNSRC